MHRAKMRSAGIGLILTTLVVMAVPIAALFDDPVSAFGGLEWFYVSLVLGPIIVGSLLFYFGWRNHRTRVRANRTSD